MIIETYWYFVSILSFGRKHQASFNNVLFFHKLYQLRVTRGHDFSKTTYLAVRNSCVFSTKISIWICWDVSIKITNDFQTSGLHNSLGKVAQIPTKHLSVGWWKSAPGNYGSGVTLQLRDRDCRWCCFLRQKELYVVFEAAKLDLESNKVLCSPPRCLN